MKHNGGHRDGPKATFLVAVRTIPRFENNSHLGPPAQASKRGINSARAGQAIAQLHYGSRNSSNE
eukprot:3579154-Rhodomonas_salina.3